MFPSQGTTKIQRAINSHITSTSRGTSNPLRVFAASVIGVMCLSNRLAIVVLSCHVLAMAGASQVAERIELTSSVATELEFKIDAEEDSGEIILTVIYPEFIDSAWKVSGTRVAYFNDRQEFATITNFEEPSHKRTVLVGFSTLHPLNDAAIDIVYRCISDDLRKCTFGIHKHYSVSSARTVLVHQEEEN